MKITFSDKRDFLMSGFLGISCVVVCIGWPVQIQKSREPVLFFAKDTAVLCTHLCALPVHIQNQNVYM